MNASTVKVSFLFRSVVYYYLLVLYEAKQNITAVTRGAETRGGWMDISPPITWQYPPK